MQAGHSFRVSRLALILGVVVNIVLLAAPAPFALSAPPRDPSVGGAWSGVINTPNTAIHLALMPNGKIFSWKGYTGLPDVVGYTWDLATNAFTPTPQVGYDPFCAGETWLVDGRLFVTGGHTGTNDFG